MTNQTTEQILETGYIRPDGDDWYDMARGTFVGTGIFGASGVLFMMKFGIPKTFHWIYILFIVGLIIYLYWRDGQIKIVNTGLTKNENLNLLRGVFNKLDWTGEETSGLILIGDDKYIMKFVRIRIFYADNFIGYNFQYTSNVRSGRPAFFLGIRTYLKTKFEIKLVEFI